MSGKFVRASKYRHVFGQSVKKELQYENVKVTNNAWDSNLIKTNGEYISVNWNASGGGAFAVIPIGDVGKLPDQVPLFRGHTAQVLDTDFDPYNRRRIASGSDDAKVGIWEIPEGYSLKNYTDEDGQPKDVKPLKLLSGHTRKVGHVLYHPTAQNILASSSLDYTVRLWDIEKGENIFTLKHPDMVTSMSFSYDGNYIATISKDKKLRVWDIRKEELVSEGLAHSGAKNQRVVWMGDSNRLATTGFSRLSDRQIGIWDAFNLDKGDLGGFYTVDQSSGILMPFYDEGNKILYLAGKGDGNIRYYEFQNDELFELSEYQSTDAQRGFAVAPKRMVNVRENEVLKCFKTVVDQRIEPISFYVPRKSEMFQDDIYPDAPSEKPALTAEEWIGGKNVDGPILVSMRTIYEGSEPEFRDSAKETASIVKEDVPVVESRKPQQDMPKGQPEKSVTPPSVSVNQVLKNDDSVDKLLEKSSQLDASNEAEDPSKESQSEWEEDAEPRVEAKMPELKTPEVDKTPEKKSPASPKKASGPPEQKTTSPKKTAAETAAGSKSLGLKQSVEKLSSLVLHLETVISDLKEAQLAKDDRLAQLEDKLNQLLKQ